MAESEREYTEMQSNFIHLHNHTDFSLLDGAAPIPRYMQRPKNWE